MGILIKGMEMPEGRGEYELLLRIDLSGTATVEGSYLRFEGEPFEAVPVPPHGRLIDADAFERLECNGCDGACEIVECDCINCDADCRCDFMLDIRAAPTIIPAEEGET